jgi:hypothetical protein
MKQIITTITYISERDPWPVLGFVLLGTFAVLFAHVQFKMSQIGYKTYPLFARPWDWGLPNEYLTASAAPGARRALS